MNWHTVASDMQEILDPSRIRVHEPMADHTSFRVGGPADLLVLPGSVTELQQCVEFFRTRGIPWRVIGNGSNLLVCDDGIDGAVIELSGAFGRVQLEGETVVAQSGALLSVIANHTLNAELTGFEFAGGIPGTLGGAVVMNAGAYGGEMKDVVESVTVLTDNGEVRTLRNEEMDFGYRHSCVPERGYIVLEARLRLMAGEKSRIVETTRDLTQRRTSKQPLHLPSAGSTFKRPPGHFAGQLVEESGLKGLRVGDAQVSEKHCGFVVNLGKASSQEILTLIRLVRRVVLDRFGVVLEPEVKMIGRRFDAEDHR